jgi:hypothetical protein
MLMSAPTQKPPAYSADIRMQLSVNGHVFVIGQLGPDFVILDAPVDHPPAEGEITLSIDGRERRWHVHLPAGIKAQHGETVISAIPNGSTVD